MKAAIYVRKSKDTQKGESTEHQVERCRALNQAKLNLTDKQKSVGLKNICALLNLKM